MFTQINQINTNKCNGCKKHCTLEGTFYQKKEKIGFLPKICNKTIIYYIDSENIKRFTRLYKTELAAIDAAYTIVKFCGRYNPKTSIVTNPTNPNSCTGCIRQCICGAKKQNKQYMPTIQNVVIEQYIDAHGRTQTIKPSEKEITAITDAKHIAARCDFYRKQKEK